MMTESDHLGRLTPEQQHALRDALWDVRRAIEPSLPSDHGEKHLHQHSEHCVLCNMDRDAEMLLFTHLRP
jgi:hypothetical protein